MFQNDTITIFFSLYLYLNEAKKCLSKNNNTEIFEILLIYDEIIPS